jgi:hypothetical protein
MSPTNQPTYVHPIVYAVKKFISKLRQHPESYPIKYYKKGQGLRRGYRPGSAK